MSTNKDLLLSAPAPSWARRALSLTLIAASIAGVGAWLVLAIAHMESGYRTDHVSGVRMALAQDAANGLLYPPLYDGERYGGTRYLPLTIVAHGELGRLVGDFTTSGRLLGYGSVLALVALITAWAVRARVPLALASALGTSLLVAEPGLGAAFGMRADGVPAALQLAALGLTAASASALAVGTAAVLAALALSAKLTAVWAPLAIAAWLLITDRRLLGVFVSIYLGVALLLFGTFTLITDGRLLDNIVGLTVAGIGGVSVAITAPNRLLRTIALHAPLLWALLPFATLTALTGRMSRRSGLVTLAIAVQVPLLLATYADIGVGVNQLIDLAALAALATGLLVVRANPSSLGGALVGLVVVWVVGTGVVTTTAFEAVDVFRDPPTEPTIAGHVEPGITILSEDPGVPVRLGQEPVVTDPFMLPRLEQLRPGAVQDLVDRIDRQQFDVIILVVPAEGNDAWWRDYHFGQEVIDVIRDRYQPSGTVDGYYLYEPA